MKLIECLFIYLKKAKVVILDANIRIDIVP